MKPPKPPKKSSPDKCESFIRDLKARGYSKVDVIKEVVVEFELYYQKARYRVMKEWDKPVSGFLKPAPLIGSARSFVTAVVPNAKPSQSPIVTGINPDQTVEISALTGRPKVIRNRPETYTKKKLVVGMKFGDLILRRKLPPKKDVKPSLRERWRVECSCGTVQDVPKYYLIRKPNPKTHCGCRLATTKSKHQRELRIWYMIRMRTRNPDHIANKHYVKRGINICDEWYDLDTGFEKFLADIGPAPSIRHSVDRIDNNKGYVPGNVAWATATSQRANQGDRIGGKTVEEIADMGITVDEWIEIVKANPDY